MAKLFALVQISNGSPDTSPLVSGVDYKGYACTGTGVAGYDACIFGGTGAQLNALNDLASVIGIVAVTEDANTKWGELDSTIASAVRTKLNTWLTNRGYPTIPAGWSYRQVLVSVYGRLNARFDLNAFDISD